MNQSAIVVGASLSGLVCARRLHQAGIDVTIVEQSDRAGGRYATEDVDGYKLDFGWQVFSSVYPNSRIELDMGALDPRAFEPGVYVWTGSRLNVMHKDHPLEMIFARHKQISGSDVMRLNLLLQYVNQLSISELWHLEDRSTKAFLQNRGFSEDALEDFFEPFLSSVLLSRDLEDSCLEFLFELKSLQSGWCLPANGFGAIVDQVAVDIPWDRYHFSQEVTGLIEGAEGVSGVILEGGKTLSADMVIVATNGDDAQKLTGVPTFTGGRSATTIHFATPELPVEDKMIITNEVGGGRVNHVVPVSLLRPGAAPEGHLVSATMLDASDQNDLDLALSVRHELKFWFPHIDTAQWRPLRVDRSAYARMSAPVGFREERTSRNPKPGLVFAGEHTDYPGIDGAIRSGQDAATIVLRAHRETIKA